MYIQNLDYLANIGAMLLHCCIEITLPLDYGLHGLSLVASSG